MVRAPACHAGSCGFKSRLSRLFQKILVFSIILILTSCGPSSLEDFKEEGLSISKSMTEELHQIHSRDDLVASSPRLKKLFGDLVDLIIAAYEFKDSHPEYHLEGVEKLISNSQPLREEVSRIYRIEGARELLEKIQEESLNRLDAYERRRTKRKL